MRPVERWCSTQTGVTERTNASGGASDPPAPSYRGQGRSEIDPLATTRHLALSSGSPGRACGKRLGESMRDKMTPRRSKGRWSFQCNQVDDEKALKLLRG